MNEKFLRLSLCLVLFATTAALSVELETPISQPNTAAKLQTPCTATNTTIAFDIDQVLLDLGQPLSSTLWDYRWDLAKNIINPVLMYSVLCLVYQRAIGLAYFELFKVQAPRLAEMVEHIMLDKKPLEGMEDMVKHLRSRAYTLVVASNMGAQDFAYYQQKFPTLFGNFDYAKVVPHTEAGIPLIKKKPSLEYFQQLKSELAEHNLAKENLVFIDDKKRNTDASIKEGFYGIQFKNALQLQAALRSIGILTTATAA